MPDPFLTPMVTLVELCERAVRHRRRQLAHLDIDPSRITYGIPSSRYGMASTGWMQISVLIDPYAGESVRIFWHPPTDRLRFQWPRMHDPAPPPGALPLYRRQLGDPVLLARQPFMAHVGYIYTYDGVDHGWEAAEWLTREQGSLDGWTWRLRDGPPD